MTPACAGLARRCGGATERARASVWAEACAPRLCDIGRPGALVSPQRHGAVQRRRPGVGPRALEAARRSQRRAARTRQSESGYERVGVGMWNCLSGCDAVCACVCARACRADPSRRHRAQTIKLRTKAGERQHRQRRGRGSRQNGKRSRRSLCRPGAVERLRRPSPRRAPRKRLR